VRRPGTKRKVGFAIGSLLGATAAIVLAARSRGGNGPLARGWRRWSGALERRIPLARRPDRESE
jgi:hypothetical protein